MPPDDGGPPSDPGDWLPAMLREQFFVNCPAHPSTVVNIFSLATKKALCPSCAGRHPPSTILQIRRSSYHEVVRVSDLGRLVDTSGVQSYLINQARVIFLNQRPQPRASKGRLAPGVSSRQNCAACVNCHRNLQSEVAAYCSIACKLARVGPAGCVLSGEAPDAALTPARAAERDAGAVRATPSGRSLGVKRLRGLGHPGSTPATPARPLSRRKGQPRRSPDN